MSNQPPIDPNVLKLAKGLFMKALSLASKHGGPQVRMGGHPVDPAILEQLANQSMVEAASELSQQYAGEVLLRGQLMLREYLEAQAVRRASPPAPQTPPEAPQTTPKAPQEAPRARRRKAPPEGFKKPSRGRASSVRKR
jgi:hypothetical protein